jgi:H+/Cl- antiporter ClcA
MTRALKCLRITLAIAVGTGCLLLDDNPFVSSASLISDAEARIGRPLTPMSYAGVARRTTRRAVAAGAAVGAAAAYAPGCYQAVDAYGRVYWRCP